MDYQVSSDALYILKEDGTYLLHVSFPVIDEGVVNIDHTYVDTLLRGQGVASEMMHETMKVIISRSYQVVATCPYAVIWLKRHKEYDPFILHDRMKTMGEACHI